MKTLYQYSEKQKIENATADSFFSIYNTENKTSYSVIRIAGDGEVPDVFAKDDEGREFNIEVTLTEDAPGNIVCSLGKNDTHSLAALKSHLQAVRAGKEKLRANSLEYNALPMLLQRIDKKLIKRYGPNTALVVRDTSNLRDWEFVCPEINKYLNCKIIPFDLGIWILYLNKTKIMKIL